MVDRDAPPETAFGRTVGAQERRKLHAARKRSSTWSGLGMLGIVGWSVGAPTLLGALVGRWLDGQHRGPHPWTLTLLFAGLCVGCASAWHWIRRQQQEIQREEDEK